jgi:3-dehydroquinate dehydratase-2
MSKTDKPVFVLNGPNLNMLGVREPEIYGRTTLAEVEAMTRARADQLGITIDFRQTNHEGVLVDWIQEAVSAASGIVINPAGSSFGSIAVLDALKIFDWPIVELHISNIHRRDALHQHSIMSTVATGVIAGMGPHGYVLAVEAVAAMLREGEERG